MKVSQIGRSLLILPAEAMIASDDVTFFNH